MDHGSSWRGQGTNGDLFLFPYQSRWKELEQQQAAPSSGGAKNRKAFSSQNSKQGAKAANA